MSKKRQMKMANDRKRLITTAKFNLIADHVKAIQDRLGKIRRKNAKSS